MSDVTVLPNAKGPIAVRIGALSQLFNSLDPFPFKERDLDKSAEEFIVGWARELPGNQPIHIVLHMPASETQKPEAKDVGPALQKYFDYRAEMTQRDLNQLFRTGRLSLAIGVAVLAAGFVATQLITGRLGESALARFFQEGLIIISWVANWKPVETFLYDWWPVKRTRNLYRRLSNATVETRAY
jgi:hypothetical protein